MADTYAPPIKSCLVRGFQPCQVAKSPNLECTPMDPTNSNPKPKRWRRRPRGPRKNGPRQNDSQQNGPQHGDSQENDLPKNGSHENGSQKHPGQQEHLLSGPSKNPSATIFTVFDPISVYPIFEKITSYLGARELVRLARTCTVMRNNIDSLKQSHWNINVKLRPFFNDPRAFRSLQAKHDLLITGIFAARFFGRRDLMNTGGPDFQIYVRGDSVPDDLRSFLEEKEGYKVLEGAEVDGIEQDPELWSGSDIHTVRPSLPSRPWFC